MGKPVRTALVGITLAFLVGACANQKSPTAPTDLKSSLSTAFDAFTIPNGNACSISVSQHGQVVLERGRGQIGPGLAASGDSLYRIASLTKPITASAILVSEKAGRLQRTDKINTYLTFPEPAPTIDQLIKHVPGLANYTDTQTYQFGRTSAA